jgi:fatty-acyl-CoA synthase
MRGNNVMLDYLNDPAATESAFAGGWFHSGDLGVVHTDGYVELHDRAKDTVISGGENIFTIEVEACLMSHPDVLEVAVVGVPRERWGERLTAYSRSARSRVLRSATSSSMSAHRSRISRAPDSVEFLEALPRAPPARCRSSVSVALDLFTCAALSPVSGPGFKRA